MVSMLALVDFVAWADGEPNACDNRNRCAEGEDVVEMDFRNGARGGKWNDQTAEGDYGIGKYPLCESIEYVSDFNYQYVGCYIDDAVRDMDGLTQDGTTQSGASNGEDGVPPPFFVMGGKVGKDDVIDGDPRAVCANLCAGFATLPSSSTIVVILSSCCPSRYPTIVMLLR